MTDISNIPAPAELIALDDLCRAWRAYEDRWLEPQLRAVLREALTVSLYEEFNARAVMRLLDRNKTMLASTAVRAIVSG